MTDFVNSWAQKYLADASTRLDHGLITVPQLDRNWIALDTSIFGNDSRLLATPALPQHDERKLIEPRPLSRPLARTLPEITNLQIDVYSRNDSSKPWCSNSRFEVPNLSVFASAPKMPSTGQDETALEHDSTVQSARPSMSQEVVCRCLTAMLRGMESALFLWDAERNMFTKQDCYTGIDGISTSTEDQLLKAFCQHGTNIRRLRLAIESAFRTSNVVNATVVALVVFVKEFLDYCLECTVIDPEKTLRGSSLMDLCSKLDSVKESAAWLSDLLRLDEKQCNLLTINAVDVLNMVEEDVRLQSCVSSIHDQIVRELFDRLLQLIMEDIASKTGLGPAMTADTGTFAVLHGDDYLRMQFAAESRPHIISSELTETLLRLYKGMRFLLRYGHADFLHTMEIERNKSTALSSWSRTSCDSSKRLSQAERILSLGNSHSLDTLARQIESQITATHQLLATSLSSDFAKTLAQHTNANSPIDIDEMVRQRIEEPIVRQAHFVHGEVLRILLQEMQLVEHLKLAQGVFLLQNGDFATKLDEAIFSENDGSLNLNYRGRKSRRWPPLAAKVSMATRHLLLDSVHSRYTIPSRQMLAEPEFLGHLGFMMSLDETPQEIPRESLDALTFLVFTFRPPKPLDLILTDRSLKLYRKINQFLLVLMRMNDATRRLTRQALPFRTIRQMSSMCEQFRIEASHFIGSFTNHVLETVISTQCCAFDKHLRGPATSIETLCEAHEHMLEQICHGALISPKMSEIQAILRKSFEAILAFSLLPSRVCGENEDEIGRLYGVFHHNAKKLIAILVGAEATKDDSFAAGISASFLMNDFWTAAI